MDSTFVDLRVKKDAYKLVQVMLEKLDERILKKQVFSITRDDEL